MVDAVSLSLQLTFDINFSLPLTQQGWPSQILDYGAQYTGWSSPCERFAEWVAPHSASLESKAIG